MGRSLIIGELTQDASADDLSGISKTRNLRHSIGEKFVKLIKTPLVGKSGKFAQEEVSPVAVNKTGRQSQKSEDLMQVFNDSESNISGEP